MLHVGLNEANLVPYIMGQLRDQELALQLAGRLGLPGCDDLFLQQFQTLMAAGDVQGRPLLPPLNALPSYPTPSPLTAPPPPS